MSSKSSYVPPKPSPKPHRDLAVINQDYVNACAQRGDLDFKIDCLQADINVVKTKQLNIKTEYTKAEEFHKAVAEAAVPLAFKEPGHEGENKADDNSGVQPTDSGSGSQG